MDAFARSERDKYARMWAVPAYSARSPGASIAADVLARLGARPGETIIDYGCGAGAAMPAFRARGLIATGVDLVRAPSNEDFPLVIAPLWDLPAASLAPSDWCYCVDVLEHLPMYKMRDALAGIAVRTVRGGFLQSALKPETFGRQIGEVLHLTVRGADWWRQIIGEFFEIESAEVSDDQFRLQVYVRARS